MQKIVKTDVGTLHYDMKESKDNPCLNCGVCCSHFRISFYFGETDTFCDNGVPESMVSYLTPKLCCMKGTEAGNQRCIALIGELLTPNIKCSIYENRPSPCREFRVIQEDGSLNPKCIELRDKYKKVDI